MVWLSDGEKILKICLLISTEYMNVTGGETDGRTDATQRLMYSIVQQKCDRLLLEVLKSILHLLTSVGSSAN